MEADSNIFKTTMQELCDAYERALSKLEEYWETYEREWSYVNKYNEVLEMKEKEIVHQRNWYEGIIRKYTDEEIPLPPPLDEDIIRKYTEGGIPLPSFHPEDDLPPLPPPLD